MQIQTNKPVLSKINLQRWVVYLAVPLALLSFPPIHAQTLGIVLSDWNNGFIHPLQGWDHLLTMLTVGIWAANCVGGLYGCSLSRL